jgi:hypothetical protein
MYGTTYWYRYVINYEQYLPLKSAKLQKLWVQFILKGWIRSQIRQNDADPTGSGSAILVHIVFHPKMLFRCSKISYGFFSRILFS